MMKDFTDTLIRYDSTLSDSHEREVAIDSGIFSLKPTIHQHASEGFFQEHPIGKVSNTPKAPTSSAWLIVVITAGFILLAWSKHFHNSRLMQYLTATFSSKQLDILDRDRKIMSDPVNIILTIIYNLSISAVICLYVNDVVMQQSGEKLLLVGYLKSLGLFATVFLGKFLLINILSNIFKIDNYAYYHKANNVVFGIFTGLMLLVLIPIYYFTFNQNFIWMIFVLILIIQVLKLIRLFRVGISVRRFSIIYLFLYLCSLEIIPLLIAVKFISF